MVESNLQKHLEKKLDKIEFDDAPNILTGSITLSLEEWGEEWLGGKIQISEEIQQIITKEFLDMKHNFHSCSINIFMKFRDSINQNQSQQEEKKTVMMSFRRKVIETVLWSI